jgi:hypothetical protein
MWDSSFVLTVQQILGDVTPNQLKSGEGHNLLSCYHCGVFSVLKIIKNLHFPQLAGNVLGESLMKWVST